MWSQSDDLAERYELAAIKAEQAERDARARLEADYELPEGATLTGRCEAVHVDGDICHGLVVDGVCQRQDMHVG